jgi:broad specificity phosphatase PhoE
VTLIFETHATSLDNEAGLASGWFDVGLSPAGERQAAELGTRYGAGALAAVYPSDSIRSRRTAEIAFGGRLAAVADSRLRECHYGTMTRQPTAAVDAERLARIDVAFPGGESYTDVVARVQAWLDEAGARHPDGTALVIGHRATWYALEHLLNGRPLAEVIAAPWRWQPGWPYGV